MASFKKIIIVVFLILIACFYCSDKEKDPVKFIVTCDGTFGGTYLQNADNPVSFGGTSTTYPYINTGAGYYFTSTKFNDLDTIIITASRDDQTDSLSIYIYRNDKKIKDALLDAEDADTTSVANTLKLEYEYNEENATTDTTPTTTSEK